MNYLALGDSYTIGEALPVIQSFPYQLVQLLRKTGIGVNAPEMIARTGWTTDELAAAMSGYEFLPSYDWVTLLIGVNNQYRGRAAANFAPDLVSLLTWAIELAGGDPQRVILLSIPDWGVTPFAAGRETATIAAEIDQYNNMVKETAQSAGTHFLGITQSTREAPEFPERIAADGLHPSEMEYAIWASRLAKIIAPATV